MKNKKIYYDEKSDSLYFLVKEGVEQEVVEVSPGVNVELGKEGELMGIEILNASKSLGGVMGKKMLLKQSQAYSTI